MKKEIKKEYREALICILASLGIAGIIFINGGTESVLKDGYMIERDSYGSGIKTYELMAGAEGVDKTPVRIELSGRKYSEAEAEQRISELMEELPEIICRENNSLDRICSDIELPSVLDKYPGIRLRWYPDDLELIEQDGSINNKELKQSVNTALKLSVTAGDIKKNFVFDITVWPAELSEAEAFAAELNRAIKQKNEEQQYIDKLELPRIINGKEVRYYEKADLSPVYIVLLGIVAAMLILMRPQEQRKKEKKLRDRELLLDYSDMVSKLLVYIGAGLTLRNAWFRIVQVYEDSIDRGRKKRSCYEEMVKTADRIKQGVPEIKAYREFAFACGLRPYIRLCSILEQNLKNGDKQLKSALELEMQEAFNERKNIARRLGEEMSTKLLLPLFISMVGVMIIVSVPALIRLG